VWLLVCRHSPSGAVGVSNVSYRHPGQLLEGMVSGSHLVEPHYQGVIEHRSLTLRNLIELFEQVLEFSRVPLVGPHELFA
jgi:hypothetical protein